MQGRVLIGVVRNAEQLKANLEYKFYHTPVGNIANDHLPVDFAALYLPQSSFSDGGGVAYIGEVVSQKSLLRGKITELSAREPEQLYYRFDVARWIRLEPALIMDKRVMVCAFTDVEALFRGKIKTENRQDQNRFEQTGLGIVYMTDDEKERVEISEETVTASQLADRINNGHGRFCVRVTKNDISDWLLKNGLLYEQESAGGKRYRVPSRAGMGLGIVTVERYPDDGRVYGVIKYRAEAQRFIIRHINCIMK